MPSSTSALITAIVPAAPGRRKRALRPCVWQDAAMSDGIEWRDGPVAGSDGVLTGRCLVPAAHPILRGHFPGAPLVAGVQLLAAACAAAAQATGRTLAIAAIDDVRWHAPLAPDAEVELRAALAPEPRGLGCAGEWLRAGDRVAAFRMVLRDDVCQP
jgi:3-hydroxymyristoyl/3-hydroxydecanoyl-(acyl carrier protein) dehydratase